MSDTAFERAMHKITAEDKQQKQTELDAENRRRLWARVRKAGLTLGGVALVGVAFVNRAEIGQQINKLTGQSAQATTPDSDFAKNLQGVREGAAKRDKTLDEIQKVQK